MHQTFQYRQESDLSEAAQRTVCGIAPAAEHLELARSKSTDAFEALGGAVSIGESDVFWMAKLLAAAQLGSDRKLSEMSVHSVWLLTEAIRLQDKDDAPVQMASMASAALPDRHGYARDAAPDAYPFDDLIARVDAALLVVRTEEPLRVRLVTEDGTSHTDIAVIQTGSDGSGRRALETWSLPSGESFTCSQDRRAQQMVVNGCLGVVIVDGKRFRVMCVSQAGSAAT